MTRQEVVERAIALQVSGFHCAESVLKASLEAFASALGDEIPRIATCFGGGVGKSLEGMCGALSGGLIAIGWLSGRNNPTEDWAEAAESALELRARFQEKFGSTACPVILAPFGGRVDLGTCQNIIGETAGIIYDLIEEGYIRTHAGKVPIQDSVIQKVEERLRQAMLAGDVKTLEELISDELRFTTHTGAVIDKRTDLATHASGQLKLHVLEPSDQFIQQWADAALVTVRMEVAGTFGGEAFSGSFRYTRVWAGGQDGWRILSGHATQIIS